MGSFDNWNPLKNKETTAPDVELPPMEKEFTPELQAAFEVGHRVHYESPNEGEGKSIEVLYKGRRYRIVEGEYSGFKMEVHAAERDPGNIDLGYECTIPISDEYLEKIEILFTNDLSAGMKAALEAALEGENSFGYTNGVQFEYQGMKYTIEYSPGGEFSDWNIIINDGTEEHLVGLREKADKEYLEKIFDKKEERDRETRW